MNIERFVEQTTFRRELLVLEGCLIALVSGLALAV